jgi:hypothetical protein
MRHVLPTPRRAVRTILERVVGFVAFPAVADGR